MPLDLPPGLMASVSGVRGRVGDDLTPELVTGLAAAFGAFLQARGKGSTILLGRDSRTSGSMLGGAASAGLQSVGCGVVNLGIVPTPTLLLAVEERGAAGGVVVSASHNPAEWNALKFCGAQGMFLDGDETEAFHRYRATVDPPRAPWDALGTVEEDPEAVARHVDRILALPEVDVEGIRERGFRVALDCVRGAGGTIMPRLLEALGCRVAGIGLEVDGLFPRDPEPTAAHLGALCELVRESSAHVGLAVDPDVDRLSLVDEKGRPVGEDLTLALSAAVALDREGGTLVTNLSTSQVVEDVVREAGGRTVRAPVGEIHVARRMEEEGAVIGGEGNGGVILPALHLTRDAPLAAALVLQFLLDGDAPLSELVSRWPSYQIVKEKVARSDGELSDLYRLVAERLEPGTRDTQDGLRLAWPERGAWVHVRPSGTEPVVRVIAEARTAAEAEELVARARAVFEGA